MVEGIAEALERISQAKGRNGKIEALRGSSSKAMKAVMGYCFDPNVEWLLPEGAPPYTPLKKSTDSQATLLAKHHMLEYFVKSPKFPNMTQVKREQVFIQFLESLDPDDAALIISIKDGNMPYDGITAFVAAKAFPTISAHWDKKET